MTENVREATMRCSKITFLGGYNIVPNRIKVYLCVQIQDVDYKEVKIFKDLYYIFLTFLFHCIC